MRETKGPAGPSGRSLAPLQRRKSKHAVQSLGIRKASSFSCESERTATATSSLVIGCACLHVYASVRSNTCRKLTCGWIEKKESLSQRARITGWRCSGEHKTNVVMTLLPLSRKRKCRVCNRKVVTGNGNYTGYAVSRREVLLSWRGGRKSQLRKNLVLMLARE